MLNYYATKLYLSANDIRTKLGDKNPIAMKKSIDSLEGPVTKLQYLRNGNIFVTCRNNQQLEKLLKHTSINSINERVIPVTFNGRKKRRV